MSMATLEREITAKAREVLKNPKLRVKDIMEWSTGTVEPRGGEVTIYLPDLQVNVSFKMELDKR